MVYTHLVRMASLTKKVIAQQSQAAVDTIIHVVSPQARLLLSLLWNGIQDKAVQMRVYCIGHLKVFLEVHGQRARHSIEGVGGVDTLEKCLKKALADANPGVRETARQTFWVFNGVWTDRGQTLMGSLDNASLKQLEKACPDPQLLKGLPGASVQTPAVKKQSVAAAIAASRAKAKAIATAPPTLRHQATSQARTTSPPAKRPTSPSLSNSQSTGPVRAISPTGRSSPRSRITSGTMPRTVSAGFMPNRDATRVPLPESPPSPTPESAFRRRLSSPLISSPSPSSSATLRRATQTALPPTPPDHSVLLQANAHTLPRGGPRIPRESVNISALYGNVDDSLLLASNIPIPQDSDSDMDIDDSLNLVSFSTPYEMYPPQGTAPQAKSAASFSPRSSSSRPPHSHALSTGTSSPPAGVPQPMVEDAMRARAEQAESAAERLLELVVDPEEGSPPSSTLPSSLLLSSHNDATLRSTPRRPSKPTVGSAHQVKPTPTPQPPKTPVSKGSATMRKVSLFQDSPAYKRKSSSSIFDMINGQSNDSVWWSKRMACMCLSVTLRFNKLTDDASHRL